MPRYGRRRRIGACDRRVSWSRGIERRRRPKPEAQANAALAQAAEPPADDTVDGDEATSESSGPGVRAPDAAIQRHPAVDMGGIHQGRLRGGQVGSGGAGRPQKGEKSERAGERVEERAEQRRSSSDPLGYTPYDQRLYDALVELFKTGRIARIGRTGRVGGRVRLQATSGGGPCAARAPRRLLGSARGRDRRRRARAGRGRPPAGLRRQRGSRRRGSGRHDPRSGSRPSGSDTGPTDGDRPAGQGLPVPRVQLHGVHRTCTTWCTGPTVARRIWKTWSPCAVGIIGPCTSWVGSVSGNADAVVTFTSPHGRAAKSVRRRRGECRRWPGMGRCGVEGRVGAGQVERSSG